MKLRTTALAVTAAALALSCGASMPHPKDRVAVSELRDRASGSNDGELLGRWLLEESFAPGGKADQARVARARLGKKSVDSSGPFAALAVGLWDEAHGSIRHAADAFADAVEAADAAEGPTSPLVAWVAAQHLASLRVAVPGLWLKVKPRMERVLREPKHAGWRTVALLGEWQIAEESDRTTVLGAAHDARVTSQMGCLRDVAIAGPFGTGSSVDRTRPFAAERAPWPPEWPSDRSRGTTPAKLATERHRCLVASKQKTPDGIFYAQSFFETKEPRDLLVAVQGALAVWVDDTLVVDRDLSQWGVWQRFGGAVRVGRGRHRIVAKLASDATSVRVLDTKGRGAGIEASSDDRLPYGLSAPQPLPQPNAIDEIVTRARKGEAAMLSTVDAVLAANIAMLEGMGDVAGALVEPLVRGEAAAPLALALAARLTHGDTIYPEQERRLRERDLNARALKADPSLWYPRAWIALDDAEQKGVVDAVEPLRKLAATHHEVPDLGEQLASVYGKLGWPAERLAALRDLAKRFPTDASILRSTMGAFEEHGELAEADAIAKQLRALDPDSEVELDRALARQDWKAAIAELKRLEERRPDRKDIAHRIAEVLQRAGDPSRAAAQLARAVAKQPRDSDARLRLADMAYAGGDTTSLRRALVDALSVGGDTKRIRAAIDLLEGATALEPYRIDGRKVIREFAAWEQRGKNMDGNAARVLDYAATWVHPDGSSEMLEHEILKIQSQEAVDKESEQRPPEGLVLRMRVVKKDGSVLEPEEVAGKPTLTMPLLEVGDCIEIEHITSQGPEALHGLRYRGPHWFFREPDKGYWRSELVVLSPKERELEIETIGEVPKAQVKEHGQVVERRWRVEESPPAPEEPDAPPVQEFLPSVRVGWGIELENGVLRLVDAAVDETPLDPRIGAIARELTAAIPASDAHERLRALYKYVTAEIQDGDERDGRRVLMGKSGSRQAAFLHLAKQLAIPHELVLVKSRLAKEAAGKMSEVESWRDVVLRMRPDRAGTPCRTKSGAPCEPLWMTLRDKFAPFGYLPAELRGQPAIVLRGTGERTTTPRAGSSDGVVFEGRADLRDDGSAAVKLTQSYTGRMAIAMRGLFEKVPEGRRRDFVESRILSRNFPGARLEALAIEPLDDASQPLSIRMEATVPQLAEARAKGFVLKSVFPVHLAQIATLPARQTPLLLSSSSHVEVRFRVVAPRTIALPEDVARGEARDGERVVTIRDAVNGQELSLDRLVDIPAGRVQPGKEYEAFLAFIRRGDELLEREIALGR